MMIVLLEGVVDVSVMSVTLSELLGLGQGRDDSLADEIIFSVQLD